MHNLRVSDSVPDERIAELDGVRGMAVLLVMGYHAFAYQMMHEAWSGWVRFIVTVTNLGWLGVDLFFVLSGFLITGILLRTKGRLGALSNFYTRRALRILPLYFAVLLIVLLAYQHSSSFVLLSAFFLANMVVLFGVPLVYGPLWSLAVEEHFYLIWPWLVRGTSLPVLWRIAGVIAVGEPVARALGFAYGWDVYYFSWFRFDGLAWGALLAMVFHLTSARATLLKFGLVVWVAAIGIFLVGLPYGILQRQRMVGAALIYTFAQLCFVGLLALILAARGTRQTFFWRFLWLRRTGDWSYCLYLIHLMLLEGWDWVVQQFGWPFEALQSRFEYYALRAVVVFPLAFAIAALSFRYFEKPILQLNRRGVPKL
jgi:peptidoglycan/LPS O-acetylase OafA/YrhL